MCFRKEPQLAALALTNGSRLEKVSRLSKTLDTINCNLLLPKLEAYRLGFR